MVNWNNLYGNGESIPPSNVLQENLHLLPSTGKALDIACGLAENSFLLARKGLSVEAWDLSDIAIARVNEKARELDLAVHASVMNVAEMEFPKAQFDVIILTHFLEQSISNAVVSALKPGGLLFYQTYTRECVNVSGPEDKIYRLKRNELLTLFPHLDIVVYREEGRLGELSSGFRDKAMLIARKTSC